MRRTILAALMLGAVFVPQLRAELKLASIFGDHMVLQREMPLNVWGRGTPGAEVAVEFSGQRKTAKCAADGSWRVTLDPLKTSAKPSELTVVSGGEKIVRGDILVGEVWLCSGQSNMFMMLWSNSPKYRQREGDRIAAEANFPEIRFTILALRCGFDPAADAAIMDPWRAVLPGKCSRISAVAFFFGRKLHEKLQVPVGLICSGWGGTRIEPWTPISGFASVPQGGELADTVRSRTPGTPRYRETVGKYLEAQRKYTAELEKAVAAGRIPSPPPEFPPALTVNKRGMHFDAAAIYNRMIHPITPLAMRGAIWYQGCSNSGDGALYKWKMHALLNGWRKEFVNHEMGFYFVQLAPFRWFGRETFFALWEAQRRFAAESGTRMAVINDVGDWNDIHPADKTQVGFRLANLALKYQYGLDGIAADFPELEKMTAEDGGRAVLIFRNVRQFTVRGGGEIRGFEAAGADGVFRPASASVSGGKILLTAPEIPRIRMVRYLKSDPNVGNLSAETGLPLGAFFRDDRTSEELAALRRGGGELIYACDLQTAWTPEKITYFIDNSRRFAGRRLARIHYRLELTEKTGAVSYVTVSMAPFTDKLAEIAVPHHVANRVRMQKQVADMEVRSNVKGVTNGRFPTGNIEFTFGNYTPHNAAKVPGAADRKYDTGDQLLEKGGYGCMQVHNFRKKETVFGCSGLAGHYRADIGIGTAPADRQPDWTHARNAGDFVSATLWISADFR